MGVFQKPVASVCYFKHHIAVNFAKKIDSKGFWGFLKRIRTSLKKQNFQTPFKSGMSAFAA